MKRSFERDVGKEKRFKRRQYNKIYYENTRKQRQEKYRYAKLGSASKLDCELVRQEVQNSAWIMTMHTDNCEARVNKRKDYGDGTDEHKEQNFIQYDDKNDNQVMFDLHASGDFAHNSDDHLLDRATNIFDDDNEVAPFCYNDEESLTSKTSHFLDNEKTSQNNRDDEPMSPKLKHSPREYSKTDIATSLCLLKRRHRCSNALLEDFLSLLHLIISDAKEKIPNSLFEVRKLLGIDSKKQPSTSSKSSSTTITICQSCEKTTDTIDKCSNKECIAHTGFTSKPYTYTFFNIRRQIEQILQRERSINFQNSSPLPSSILTDIKDGRIYHNFLSEMNVPGCRLITLTLSTDGVQIGTSTEKSLWLITLTINEIKQSERFLLHNVIIGGINNCFKKPSRQIMKLMIDPIVEELKDLQGPKCCYIKSANNNFELYSVHLLGSINDKPATALIQNIAEPNAAYGCSRCEIKGKTTLSNPRIAEKESTRIVDKPKKKTFKETHRIRVFVLEPDQPVPKARSTERYQTIVKARFSNGVQSEVQYRDAQHGYLGPCLLSDLAFFDQGRSFMSDTLHTLYGGAMKKMLCLWFDRKWCTKEKPWTIESKLSNINSMLRSFHSPSTTVRIPRDLKLHGKYKGSEYRSTLLVFYPIFQDSLPRIYYDHMKCLVFAAHIGEGHEIEQKDVETMQLLLNEFVNKFHTLYGERHCVNTIHSIIHFPESVRDYGPLQNYSTFNYESILGAVTSTIHGCRKQDKELFNNMELIRQSSYVALEKSLDSPLYEYMLKLVQKEYRKPRVQGEFKIGNPVTLKNNERDYFQKLYLGEKIQAFYRCHYENVQYTSYNWKNSKFDTAILFRKNNADKLKFAIIDKFIVCGDIQTNLFVHVYELEDEYPDYIILNGVAVENSNTAIGKINFNVSLAIEPSQIVEKVFFFKQNDICFFIRLPNKSESS